MPAYQTGTAETPLVLRGIIEGFCTANGFTLNNGAGSWLSKGQTHVRLSVSPVYGTAIANYDSTRAYLNTTTAHGLAAGDSFSLSGANQAVYNSTFTVYSAPSSTRIVFTPPGPGVPVSASGVIFIEAVNLSTPAPSATTLVIRGANSSDGLTSPCDNTMAISIPSGSWPVTYYLFYGSAPDQVTCMLRYDSTKYQSIMFGDLVKVHANAYAGGNWFFANRRFPINAYFPGLCSLTDTNLSVYYNSAGSPLPFPTVTPSSIQRSESAQVHCEIDGAVWNGATNNLGYANITITEDTVRALYRSPNAWNSQAHLVPMHLRAAMASSLFGYLGYVEHIRLLRIDNYDAGDIITLGSDQWMVFPCLQKNTTQRNGETSDYPSGHSYGYSTVYAHSGTLGYAIRYVP